MRSLKRESLGLDNITLGAANHLEERVHNESVFAMLKAEIETLPEKQRQAISLRVFEDLSFREIAEIMDCPYDTAKANYRHALLKLKGRIESHPEFRLMEEANLPASAEQTTLFAEVKS